MAARSTGPTRLDSPSGLSSEVNFIDLRDGDGPQVEDQPPLASKSERPSQLRQSRFFGSPAFRRLWISQVFSALGDWIGFIAITAIASRNGANLGGVSLVLSARLIPGFFLSPIAGLLVDRYSRKVIMVTCDFGRFAVLCLLPFSHNLAELFVASLALELFTTLWSPAKEASVPHLVPRTFLPNANSLSMGAAYGTFPFASIVFAVLAKVPDWIGQSHFFSVNLNKNAVAVYFDALTYLLSAAVIATLAISHERKKPERSGDESAAKAGMKEIKEGWSYIARNPRVLSVIIGLGTGLVGGGMIVPLGPTFATVVLSAGSSGYGLLLSAMGTGVAVGVVGLIAVQKKVDINRVFTIAILGAGAALVSAATMHGLLAAVLCIGVLGLFAGAVYVLGFTIVQLNTVDEMRGRVFATLYTLTRSCILFALVIAPLLSPALGDIAKWIFGSPARVPGVHLMLPGVRITFWLAGFIIIIAGLLAAKTLRGAPSVEGASAEGPSPEVPTNEVAPEA